MIVKHAKCLDPKYFDSNNTMEPMKLLLKSLTFLKVTPATTGDKALLQFLFFIQTWLRTGPEKIQTFKPSKQRLKGLFFKELTSVSLHEELCMILQVIFTISHGQASVERGFSLNKNPLAKNVEELTIQSCCLIKESLLNSMCGMGSVSTWVAWVHGWHGWHGSIKFWHVWCGSKFWHGWRGSIKFLCG